MSVALCPKCGVARVGHGPECVEYPTRAEFTALKADLATVAGYLAKVDIRYVDGLPIKERAALTRIASEGKP